MHCFIINSIFLNFFIDKNITKRKVKKLLELEELLFGKYFHGSPLLT